MTSTDAEHNISAQDTSVKPMFKGRTLQSGASSSSRNLNLQERKFKVPNFQHAYTKHSPHSLTAQCVDETHRFLASHGVDKQLGPELWPAFVSQRTPEVAGFVFVATESRDVSWLCKLMGFVFAIDSKMDESDYADNPDQSCGTVLGITLALLWYNTEDERLLENLKPLYSSIATEESKALVQALHEDLVHAKRKTKNLMDVEMTPIASAFRELWVEYCQAVPAEFHLRQAHAIQDYLMAVLWEANNRKAGYQMSLKEYLVIRRLSGFILPFIIASDMLIARSLKVTHIPNSLFYGPEMQNLMVAVNDILGWHNDIFSFHKEVILAEDGHNLVKIMCDERNCTSYTEAGEIALQSIHDRIVDMERAYDQLKAVASPEYHPAIDRYMETCRNLISGSHEWHLISPRYNVAGTSIQ